MEPRRAGALSARLVTSIVKEPSCRAALVPSAQFRQNFPAIASHRGECCRARARCGAYRSRL